MQYNGTVLLPGDKSFLDSQEICCQQCQAIENCNVWTYCPHKEGCGIGHAAQHMLQLAAPPNNETGWKTIYLLQKVRLQGVLAQERREAEW